MPDDTTKATPSASDKKPSNGAARDATAPTSFLDDSWSWSSPSTWPLSVRFLPFPITFAVLFLGVYIQHFLMSPLEVCIRDFDYGLPIPQIEQLATDLATHDWEQGTAAEALLELYSPEHSVFSQESFVRPPGKGVLKIPAMRYILHKIRLQQSTLSNNTWGVSDPASLGVFAIMAAEVHESADPINLYQYAVHHQFDYLMNEAPRYANGAISHRIDVAELWSDAIFMFPPYLAYYATYPYGEGGTLLMKQVVQQIERYRNVLIITEGESKGAWKHIVGPSNMSDPGAWSTGNGWAAYGMARVRATLAGWSPGKWLVQPQIASLDKWMTEIIDAAIRTDDHPSGLLRNYLGDETWFGETAGTSLLAAAAYRLAGFLEPGEEREKYISWAAKKREVVFKHVDARGVAKPAVNSLKHRQREPFEGVNPEGESFLLLLAAAWRDCVCSGVCESGRNAGRIEI